MFLFMVLRTPPCSVYVIEVSDCWTSCWTSSESELEEYRKLGGNTNNKGDLNYGNKLLAIIQNN